MYGWPLMYVCISLTFFLKGINTSMVEIKLRVDAVCKKLGSAFFENLFQSNQRVLYARLRIFLRLLHVTQ